MKIYCQSMFTYLFNEDLLASKSMLYDGEILLRLFVILTDGEIVFPILQHELALQVLLIVFVTGHTVLLSFLCIHQCIGWCKSFLVDLFHIGKSQLQSSSALLLK